MSSSAANVSDNNNFTSDVVPVVLLEPLSDDVLSQHGLFAADGSGAKIVSENVSTMELKNLRPGKKTAKVSTSTSAAGNKSITLRRTN